MSKRYRHHTLEYKQQILSEIENGARTKAAICREEHLADSMVERWQQHAREGTLRERSTQTERQQAKELDWYKKKVAELTRDIDLLKKTALFSLPMKRSNLSLITERNLASKGDVR
jgi:transposase-like protein